MSERMTAEIAIGGRLPARHVPRLLQVLQAEGICLNAAEERFTPHQAEDLLEAARFQGPPGPLRLLDHEVAEGRFPFLEEFLIDRRIAFDRWSAGCRDWDPELVRYRPEWPRPLRHPATFARMPLVELEPVQAAWLHLQQGDPRQAQALLDRLLGPRIDPLAPLEIVEDA